MCVHNLSWFCYFRSFLVASEVQVTDYPNSQAYVTLCSCVLCTCLYWKLPGKSSLEPDII